MANRSDATLSVIDTSNDEVIDTLEMGVAGIGLAVSPSGDRVYVSDNFGPVISIADVGTRTLTALTEIPH